MESDKRNMDTEITQMRRKLMRVQSHTSEELYAESYKKLEADKTVLEHKRAQDKEAINILQSENMVSLCMACTC